MGLTIHDVEEIVRTILAEEKRKDKIRDYSTITGMDFAEIEKRYIASIIEQLPPSKRPWHPSDEALLERALRTQISIWAKDLDRTPLAIKYKIAKIIKAEGIKV